MATPSRLLSQYTVASSYIEKLACLKELTSSRAIFTDEIFTLTTMALEDRNSAVVAEGARIAGRYAIKEHAEKLMTLYHESSKFRGYSERVEIAIIEAMATVGDDATSEFLLSILETQSATSSAEAALNSLKKLNNPATIEAVRNYHKKMDTMITNLKAKGANPLLQSRYIHGRLLAADLLSTLNKVGK